MPWVGPAWLARRPIPDDHYGLESGMGRSVKGEAGCISSPLRCGPEGVRGRGVGGEIPQGKLEMCCHRTTHGDWAAKPKNRKRNPSGKIFGKE